MDAVEKCGRSLKEMWKHKWKAINQWLVYLDLDDLRQLID